MMRVFRPFSDILFMHTTVPEKQYIDVNANDNEGISIDRRDVVNNKKLLKK
jgi:hypothetical protein